MIRYVVAGEACTLDEKILKLSAFCRQEHFETNRLFDNTSFIRNVLQRNVLGAMERYKSLLTKLSEDYASSEEAARKIIELYNVQLPKEDIIVLVTNGMTKLVNVDLDILTSQELILCGCAVASDRTDRFLTISEFVLSLFNIFARRGAHAPP